MNADLLVTCDISHCSSISNSTSSILDLSQRTTTTTTTTINPNCSFINWTNDSICNNLTDRIDDIQRIEIGKIFNIEQSLTDQWQEHRIKEDSMSDSSNINQSKLDYQKYLTKKINSSRIVIIHELEPCLNSSPYSLSNFLWSKYFSIIDQRSISEEFFDHYLASINSALEIHMKLEYCYDIQRDLYWLTEIQLISHSLVLLHYVGLTDDDISNDFWGEYL